MGLLANLRRRKFQRRYRAARALLLAQYTFSRLDAARKADVLDRVNSYYSAVGELPARPSRGSNGLFWPSYLMLSMHSLGIDPALDGEHWPLPEEFRRQPPRQSLWTLFPQPPGLFRIADRLALDYRLFDPATEEARRDLLACGINLADSEGDPLDEVHHYIGGGFGRPVTWREWWRSKA